MADSRKNVLHLETVPTGSGIDGESRWAMLGCSSGKAKIISDEGTESGHNSGQTEFCLMVEDVFGPFDVALVRRTNNSGAGEVKSEFSYFLCFRSSNGGSGGKLLSITSEPGALRPHGCWCFNGHTGEIRPFSDYCAGYVLRPDDPGYLDALAKQWTWQDHYRWAVGAAELEEWLGEVPEDAAAARKLAALAIKHYCLQQHDCELEEGRDHALTALCDMLHMEDDPNHVLYAMFQSQGGRGTEHFHALLVARGLWQVMGHLASEAELQDLRGPGRRLLQPKQPGK